VEHSLTAVHPGPTLSAYSPLCTVVPCRTPTTSPTSTLCPPTPSDYPPCPSIAPAGRGTTALSSSAPAICPISATRLHLAFRTSRQAAQMAPAP